MIKISKIIKTGLLGAILAIGFTGCIETKAYPPEYKKLHGTPEEINITYNFVDEINKKNIDNQRLINILQKKLSKNSNFFDKRRTYTVNYDVYYYGGKKVSYLPGMFNISYINGGHYGKNVETFVKFSFPIKIQNTNNIYNINIKFDPNYSITNNAVVLGHDIKLLNPFNVLKQDAMKMFNSLKNTPIIIRRSLKFKGEINTKYPDKAVYANFKRILGNYSWRDYNRDISEVKKQNTFSLMVNKTEFPLFVEVYPYRDGSKVIYSTNLGYIIDSKGNSTLSHKKIEELHKKIKDIINN